MMSTVMPAPPVVAPAASPHPTPRPPPSHPWGSNYGHWLWCHLWFICLMVDIKKYNYKE